MNGIVFGLGLFGTGVVVLVTAVVSIVVSYLFLRANPNKAGQVKTFVDNTAKRL